MLKFISFGSGSSGNSYYLYTETDSLLIDVGVGIRTLKKHFHNYGLRFEDVHHILITCLLYTSSNPGLLDERTDIARYGIVGCFHAGSYAALLK